MNACCMDSNFEAFCAAADSVISAVHMQDGPKPAWRYLVEKPTTPTELPDPAGPRPHHFRNGSDEAAGEAVA